MAGRETWTPRHFNESHPGLLSDVNSSDSPYETTSRTDYQVPVKLPFPRPLRREKMKEFFWHEFAQEFFDQMNNLNTLGEDKIGEDGTTYNAMYGIEGFVPLDYRMREDKELTEKYPLYSDAPITIHLDNLSRIKRNPPSLNPNHVFRKSSSFVKKWYDELE